MKKKTLYIAFISLLIWALCVCFGYVSYDVNDDAGMNMAAAGAYGAFSQYLVYTNIVLGFIIKFFYMIFPGINCYLWFYLITDLFAVIMLAISFSDKLSLKQSVIITFFLNILLAGEFYIHIHYSKSAVLYVVAASIYMIVLIGRNEKISKLSFALASIMFVLGFCVRIQSFESVLPFVTVLFAFGFLAFGKSDKKVRFRLVLIPLVVCALCFAINYYAYYMTQWRDFKVSDDILIKVRDFGMYDYGNGAEDYEAEGITYADFDMIHHWMFNDPETFNEENLRKLEQIGKEHENQGIISLSALKNTIKEFLSRFNNRSVAGLLVVIILLTLTVGDRWLIIQNLMLFGLAFSEYYYLILKGRFFWRVEVIIWLAAVLICGFSLTDYLSKKRDTEIVQKDAETDKKKKCITYGAFAVILFLFIFVKSEVLDNSRFTNGDSKYEDFQAVRNADAHFIMYNVADYGMLMGAKDIFDIDRKYADYYKNITEMGGSGNSPSGLFFANKIGITNPAKALFEKDNVYFIGDDEAKDVLKNYLIEKYDSSIDTETVEVDGVKAWKFCLN